MDTTLFKTHLRLPLKSFDLEIAFESAHQVLGVFGKSGSGKTTFLEAVAGLRANVTGHFQLNGVTWLDSDFKTQLPPQARRVGYVPQDHLLFPHWNVLQNLESGSHRIQKSDHAYQKTKNEIIEILNLEKLLKRYPDQLSGGEKQRVALGRALCSNPSLLLLDEPLASLDLNLRQKILPYLLKIKNAFRIPILIVSHNPIELSALCDEVIAIENGKVIAQGTPNNVFTQSDIYDLASAEGYQNILTAYLESTSPQGAIVRIGHEADAPRVTLPHLSSTQNTNITIGIGASDILVSTRPISGLSARNCIPATIQSITEQTKNKQLIHAKLANSNAPTLSVELTPEAVTELNLSVQGEIWLVFKSNSIQIYR